MKISRWRLRGVIGAVSLLLVGALLGMLGGRAAFAHLHPVEADTESLHEAAMASFQDVLELEEGQARAIHEMLMERQARVDAAWQSLREEILVEIEAVHEEIRSLLTPEQRERFEAWLERHVMDDAHGDLAFRWLH